MAPRCYVSYKSIDRRYRDEIVAMGVDTASSPYDGSADYDDERILVKLRNGSLSGTSITLYLIGTHSAETLGWEKQKYIKRELQASMLPSGDGLPNTILGVVLPEAYHRVYDNGAAKISDATVVREFSGAYSSNCGCTVLRWDEFKEDPQKYIMEVYAARVSGDS